MSSKDNHNGVHMTGDHPQIDPKTSTSTLTVQLPESLKKQIETLAEREGFSVSQVLASATGEKRAVMLTMDYLRRDASAGRREDFEKYLVAVPGAPSDKNDQVD